MKPVSKNILYGLLLFGIIVSFFSACENSFNPLKENTGFAYTMYTTLDLSADTQWVRAMPIRNTIYTSPKPIDATVTITRNSTGEEIVLQDSLMRFSGEYYAWNFWTDTPLHAEEEYTIRAESPDGKFSQGIAYVPNNFNTPEVEFSRTSNYGRAFIDENIGRIVVAEVIYSLAIDYPESTTYLPDYHVSHLDDIEPHYTGDYLMNIDDMDEIFDDLNLISGSLRIVSGTVRIVSGGPNWPELIDVKNGTTDIPDYNSNVENGLGIITGIVSKEVPLISD